MKKRGIMLLFTCFFAFFISCFCVAAKDYGVDMYQTETLEEVFVKEGIANYDLSAYNRTDLDDKRVNIYLFRLSGCLNCKGFLNYTAQTLLKNYGDKIKITSFEMRDNPRNNNLRLDIQAFRGENNNVAPYIVIGNKSWSGPVDSIKQEQIAKAIEEFYVSQDKYDVLKDMSGKLFSHNGVTLVSEQSLNKDYTLQAIMTNRQDLFLEDGYQFIYSLAIDMYQGNQIVPIANQGNLQIHVSMPGGFDQYKVAYVDASGKIVEVLNATHADNDLQFTTTHLSEYAIFGKKKDVTPPDEEKPSTPDTGTTEEGEGNNDSSLDKEENNSNTDVKDEVVNNPETEDVPQTFDNVQNYVLLLFFGIMTFIISIVCYTKQKSRGSM